MKLEEVAWLSHELSIGPFPAPRVEHILTVGDSLTQFFVQLDVIRRVI
ncbi:hypothetical protein ACFL1S_06190 [Pseudomonadota bacterium]